MLIDIDSRRPLKFSRKVESKDGDEITIEIKYELLFKHCSTCGMLTHEKDFCPSQDTRSRLQTEPEKTGIFTRLQLPVVQHQNHNLQRGSRCISHRAIARNNGLLCPSNIKCRLLDMWELIRSMSPPNPILVKVVEHIKIGSSDVTMITQGVISMGVLESLRFHMTALTRKLGDIKWRNLWRSLLS